MLAVKDFRWIAGKQAYAGARCNSVEFRTLTDGSAPCPMVISILDRIALDGLVSFHCEYQRAFNFRDLDFDGVVEQTITDLRIFTDWINTVQGVSQ